jgi:hypothetical protein
MIFLEELVLPALTNVYVARVPGEFCFKVSVLYENKIIRFAFNEK